MERGSVVSSQVRQYSKKESLVKLSKNNIIAREIVNNSYCLKLKEGIANVKEIKKCTLGPATDDTVRQNAAVLDPSTSLLLIT